MSDWGSDNGDDNAAAEIQIGSDAGGSEKAEREPVTYVPEYDANEDDDIYKNTINRGIDFDKYFNVPIKVTGKSAPAPINTFEDASLHPKILENIKKCGWNKPTPIQMYSIPIISKKRDLMACAQTGSGKTGGYAIPIIDLLLKDEHEAEAVEDRGPIKPACLIVAPTRELVQQIQRDCVKLCKGTKIIANYCVGGHAVRAQLERMQEGTSILVATPGRLSDFIGKNKVNLEDLQFLVLDEADRMLDMGFGQNIKDIANKMSEKSDRTTLMFSATFKDDVQTLAKELVKDDYLFAAVGIVGGAADSVSQTVLQVEKKETFKELINILEPARETKERTLIFVETKRQTDFISSKLCQMKFPATSIHGDRSQNLREEALADFKSGDCNILVGTNVAARGLDIPNVSHVVNMEMPKEIDEYVHRIGRTGRCGNKGKATSFYNEERDNEIKAQLVQILAGAQQEVPSFLQGGTCNAAVSSATPVCVDDDEDGW